MLGIIIPFLKLTYFEATLQSLADQTDKRFKVYIGDDASPEDCSYLFQQFKGSFDFVYHRFENNLGGISLTQQWDRCIDLSNNEEWLMILGDDDVLGKNVMEAFYKNLELINKNKSNVIRFASIVIDAQTKILSGPYLHPELELASNFIYKKIKGLTRSSLSEYIFKREGYEKHHFINYPLAWHSDDKAWLDFSDDKPIFTINSALINVRFSEINISGKKDNINLKIAASFLFFKDILKNNYKYFTENQLLEILLACEEIVKKHRQLKANEWLFLCKYYVRYFRVLPFLKLIRRIVVSFLT